MTLTVALFPTVGSMTEPINARVGPPRFSERTDTSPKGWPMTRLDQNPNAAPARPTAPSGTSVPPGTQPSRNARSTLAVTSAATAVALMTYTAPMVTLPETAADLHTPLSAQAWLLNGTPLG